MSDPGHRTSGQPGPRSAIDQATELEFTEYTDDYGSIALLHDPETAHAWIQSTHWTTVER